MDAYAIGCGVLATIEQWYPTRTFNGTMVPHKRNSKVWPGLVTKEKTIKYPTSAMCTVYMHAGMAAIGPALEFPKIKLGLEVFKKHQTTAIRNFVEGHDLLLNLPTAFGKSVIYQAATNQSSF